MSENANVTETAPADSQPAENTPVVNNESELPSWAQKELKSVRSEAASYRIAARDAKIAAQNEVKAELAALSDQKAAIQAENDGLNLALNKYKAALEVGIPGESIEAFTERLKGNTLDEIKADAEKLKSYFAVPGNRTRPVDPSQGKGSNDSAATTPEAAFAQMLTAKLTKR